MDANDMSLLELVEHILSDVEHPMKGTELFTAMLSDGREFKGPTPIRTITSQLYINIAQKEDSPFYKDDEGRFGLVKQLSDADKIIWSDKHVEIINSYNQRRAEKATKAEAKPEIKVEYDIKSAPSYTKIREMLGDNADSVLADLQLRVNAYLTNTKKYMTATNRITLEYTKSTIVLPFIQLLGYSVFNPDEVLPNKVIRDNKQIDYTINDANGNIRFTISCLSLKDSLDKQHWLELRNTFSDSKNTIALLTNGIDYNIYTIGDRNGDLSELPFASFNIFSSADLLAYLIYLSKDYFSRKSMTDKSLESAIVDVLLRNFKEPSDEFVSFVLKQIGSKSTKNSREISKSAIKNALTIVRKMED